MWIGQAAAASSSSSSPLRRWAVEARQSGAVRTNCLDSLDRTNKVQTKLAWWVLARQVRYY
jgi:hypothetical protein